MGTQNSDMLVIFQKIHFHGNQPVEGMFHHARKGDAEWDQTWPVGLNWNLGFGFHLAVHFQLAVHTGCGG